MDDPERANLSLGSLVFIATNPGTDKGGELPRKVLET
jgi:hypothetical protein